MTFVLSALDQRITVGPLLGEGGMGTVHRAWDTALERAVAVKFVRSGNPKETERLLLEARLQARVEHPNVVRIHEVGLLGGRACIVMQLVEGATIAHHRESLDLRAKVALMIQAARGLHAAHREGLIHRDVKPGNILVAAKEDGTSIALVSDFGLARDAEEVHSQTGLPAGTLDFMAPEVILGRTANVSSDIYSLGASLYQVLSGYLPFRDTTRQTKGLASQAPTDLEDHDHRMLSRILEEDAPRLDVIAPGVPRDLAIIVGKAMEKDPRDRYASAETFAEDLARWERGEPILAKQAGVAERLLKLSRRNPLAARATAAALAILLIGVGSVMWTSRRSGLRSLEAARYGALAESLEARVRQENLAPAHDLTQLFDGLRVEAERLKQMARKGGPAAFACGRALDLQGEWDDCRTAYQRAWDTGYRDPAVADSLALVLVRIYDRDLRRARATLAPAALQKRQAQLDQTLRDPALALLAKGDPQSWKGPWARVILASLQGKFDEARCQARLLHERDAQRYEAWSLEGGIWLDQAAYLGNENRQPECEAACREAERLLLQAAAWGRSDNRPLMALARSNLIRSVSENVSGRNPSQAVEAALAWIDKALVLRPSAPDLLHAKASAWVQWARNPLSGDIAKRLALAQSAIDLYERAAAVEPAALEHHSALASTCALFIQLQLGQGTADQRMLEKGAAQVHLAESISPENPDVHTVAAAFHYQEADTLKVRGQDPEPALRAALASGQRALDLQTGNALRIRMWLVPTQFELALRVWRKGGDPTMDLRKAAEAAEAAIRENPGVPGLYENIARCIQSAADQTEDFDGDTAFFLARTMDVLDRAEKVKPGHPALAQIRGATRMVEAYGRCLHDEDPGQPLAEARRLFRSLPPERSADFTLNQYQAVGSLIEARWALHQGRSPEGPLADLERRLKPFAAKVPPVNQNLAQAALVRGQWLHAQGHRYEAEAQRGLAAIAVAIQADPGDPSLRVIRARLQALTGQRNQAETSLAEARKLNVLIERNPDYKRAMREAAAVL